MGDSEGIESLKREKKGDDKGLEYTTTVRLISPCPKIITVTRQDFSIFINVVDLILSLIRTCSFGKDSKKVRWKGYSPFVLVREETCEK